MVKKRLVLVLPHFLALQLILALLTLVKSESGKLVVINEADRGLYFNPTLQSQTFKHSRHYY